LDIKADLPSYEAFLNSTEEYCVDYDFEPENAQIKNMAWTFKQKWFCSIVAITDMQEMLCLN
jgi:hypothetical protein